VSRCTKRCDAINKEVTLDDRGSSSLSCELRVSQGAEVLEMLQGTYIKDLCASMNLAKESSKARLRRSESKSGARISTARTTPSA
jgi:hypothetical protein